MDEVFDPAGFWIRLAALIVDGIILFLGFGFLSLAIYGSFVIEPFSFVDLLSPLYYVLLPVFWVGYTLGKKALGIRIVKLNGEDVGIGAMIMREIVGGLIYAVTFGIGVIVSACMVGFTENKWAIHDYIAGTYVT
ncbi:RDD family protein [Alkalibacillus aidingensis]|uniref:RDD family protein n=1 Tax=Alkalibacillus aidingensis TaxID=2747607 RepID=UPI0016606FF1|nr:RDD family protein [Alkalibacillus aidingensis]